MFQEDFENIITLGNSRILFIWFGAFPVLITGCVLCTECHLCHPGGLNLSKVFEIKSTAVGMLL